MLNPKTREATAFYAALAVALYDIGKSGFQFWNTVFLSALAGLGTAGLIGLAVAGTSKTPEDPEPDA